MSKSFPLVCAAGLLAGAASSQPVVVNFIAHGPFPGGVGYDAVTDEVVVIDSTADTVSFYNRASGVLNSSFAAPSANVIGGQVDISTGNIWICDEGEMVWEVTRAGAVLRSWSARPTILDASALTIDPCSNTIWISNDSANIVAEFTAAGVATGRQFAPAGSVDGDGCVYDPVTRTFLMGEDTGDQIIIVDRNGAMVRTIPLGGLGVSPEGLAIDWLTRNVFIGNGLVAPLGVYEVSGILAPPPAGAISRYGMSCGSRIAVSDMADDDGLTCAGLWLGYQSAAAPGGISALYIGTARQAIPLAFLGSNCILYALPDVIGLVAPTNVNGRLGARLPIPPRAVGLRLTFWGADLVAGPPFVNTASEGLEIIVQ